MNAWAIGVMRYSGGIGDIIASTQMTALLGTAGISYRVINLHAINHS